MIVGAPPFMNPQAVFSDGNYAPHEVITPHGKVNKILPPEFWREDENHQGAPRILEFDLNLH